MSNRQILELAEIARDIVTAYQSEPGKVEVYPKGDDDDTPIGVVDLLSPCARNQADDLYGDASDFLGRLFRFGLPFEDEPIEDEDGEENEEEHD